MKHLSSAFAPMALLGLLLGGYQAQAQDFYNNGATITLTGGASLYIPGNLTNDNSGSITTNGSTIQVGGNVTNQNSATVGLGTAGTWDVKGNVTNTATITPGTGTLQLTGTAAQTLSANGSQVYNLIVNNTAGTPLVNVSSNVTVNNQLTMTSGMVNTTSANTVLLADGATISGEQNGRYVAGNLAAVKASVSGATTFPNSITITPATTLTNLTVVRKAGLSTAQVSYGTNASGANKGIDRIWTTSTPLTNATVQTSWLSDNDNGLTNFANSQMWARSAAPVASSDWTAISNSQNAVSRTAAGTVPSGSSLSFFTVSTTDAPLPVELTKFTAVREGDVALLSWSTASEKNNDHFDLQVSTDGRTFTKFAEVKGQGTKATPTNYTSPDAKLLAYHADPVYYRLRQVDTDGKVAFSQVQAVRVATTAGFTAYAYPNPATKDGTTIQIRTGEAGLAVLDLYDATGRLVLGVKTELSAGLNEVKLQSAANLATGSYFLKINQAKQHTMVKLLHE